MEERMLRDTRVDPPPLPRRLVVVRFGGGGAKVAILFGIEVVVGGGGSVEDGSPLVIDVDAATLVTARDDVILLDEEGAEN